MRRVGWLVLVLAVVGWLSWPRVEPVVAQAVPFFQFGGASAEIPDDIETMADGIGQLSQGLNEDSTHDETAGSAGPLGMGECDDTSTDAVDEGDAAKLRADCTTRALVVTTIDPCASGVKVTKGVSLAEDGEFIDGTTSQKTYICAIWLVASAAEIVSIVSEDDDGSCNKTSGVALIGSTTDAEGASFAENGGVSSGTGAASVLLSDTAGDDLCIYLNGTNRVAGSVTYVKRVP